MYHENANPKWNGQRPKSDWEWFAKKSQGSQSPFLLRFRDELNSNAVFDRQTWVSAKEHTEENQKQDM